VQLYAFLGGLLLGFTVFDRVRKTGRLLHGKYIAHLEKEKDSNGREKKVQTSNGR
jgi:hypothetical protein